MKTGIQKKSERLRKKAMKEIRKKKGYNHTGGEEYDKIKLNKSKNKK